MRADQTANPVRSPESDLHAARRGISLWSAQHRPGRVVRGGAPLLASSLARRIPRFFVPGGRATRHPLPGPPAPSETTTATVAESCTANVPVACPGPPSLVSQSDDGIDAHRAACWNVTRGTRHAY